MTRMCAVCLSQTPPFRKRPLGRNDALVDVCATCDDEHPRSGRYAFAGSESPRSDIGFVNANGHKRGGKFGR